MRNSLNVLQPLRLSTQLDTRKNLDYENDIPHITKLMNSLSNSKKNTGRGQSSRPRYQTIDNDKFINKTLNKSSRLEHNKYELNTIRNNSTIQHDAKTIRDEINGRDQSNYTPFYREAFINRLLYLLNLFATSVVFLFYCYDYFLILFA